MSLSDLRTHYRKQVDQFIKKIISSASEKKMSDMIFSDIRGQLEILERDVQNKQTTLDRLNRCLAELNW